MDDSAASHEALPPAEPSAEYAAINMTTQPASAFNRRFLNVTTKAGWPLNKVSHLVGAEGWWPSTMSKECNKAARILHSFTALGVPHPPTKDGPLHPMGLTNKSLVTIPPAVLRGCAGLAIFNTIRAGALHGSLAAGSGLVVARRPDGSWSPPSSFVVSTVGGGFMIGLDIYECVCVLNSREQLHAFTSPRLSLGGEASIAIGPVGSGGNIETALSRTAKPMWTYMKSRGFWAGIQIDGTVILARPDANAVFYNQREINPTHILHGSLDWPMGGKALHDVLDAVDGRASTDVAMVREVDVAVPADVGVEEAPAEGEKKTAVYEYDVYAEDDEKERLARDGF